MNARVLSLLVGTALLAGAIGFVAARNTHSSAAPASAAARTVKFYQSPMHPWIKSDKPGKCTICGMDLVPVYEGESGLETKNGLVTLTPATTSVIGVQTAEVRRGPLTRTIRVTGVLDDDETRHRVVAAHVPGRIEKLHVNQVGAHIEAGEPLATLYSPEIQTAQRVYVERVRAGPSGFTASERAAAREQLLAMGMLPDEIAALEETQTPSATITVHALFSGTIITRAAYEGQYVNTHEKLFEIGDFSHLWFIFDAYERDLPWLRAGQSVEITTPSRPGDVFTAPITFIDPNLDETSRTARVRVVLKNPDGKLPHRATATGRLRVETPDALLVPRSSVVHTQEQPLVYVDKGGDTYEPRTIEIERAGDDAYAVRRGLNEGERVVTQGALLIDGQAQLAHSAAGGHDHSGANTPSISPAPPAPASRASRSDDDIADLKPLVLAAADAADALASDDLESYRQQLPALQSTLKDYIAAHPDAAKGPLAQFAEGLKPGPDLKAARAAFEVFSTAVADLAKAAHLHHAGAVKIFQCPMSPVLGTGRWVQRAEPLRNPFFGSAMLTCGEEIH